MRAISSVSLCAAALLAGSTTAGAATLLQENFSGATPGANNSLAGTAFSVTGGAVDVIGELNGSFFTCVNNPGGNCVDMVGTPGLGTISSTATFTLDPSNSYTISFGYILQGYSPGDSATSQFSVSLGSYSTTLTAVPSVNLASLNFTPAGTETNVHLVISTLTEPDIYHGAVIDHILLTAAPVPLPAGLPLLATALGIAGLRGRRRHH